MCCEVNLAETETSAPVEPTSRSARRRMEIHEFNFVPNCSTVAPPLESRGKRKRQKLDAAAAAVVPVICENAARSCKVQRVEDEKRNKLTGEVEPHAKSFCVAAAATVAATAAATVTAAATPTASGTKGEVGPDHPKFGMTSVCGRRRDMEDAVAIHPAFCGPNPNFPSGMHFFGVYDGHGCSHVATRCRDRMHEIVKEDLQTGGASSWERTMLESFSKMDKDIGDWCSGRAGDCISACRCELQTPQCDAVGSTAVVAVVTPDKIVVSNCGDSRAVLCRNGIAIPLSVDHKPDRPDELNRIQEAGGRVIYWDGPRVLGVLAMSRAIGDNYLKPYVISEPEVTITERTSGDECLILASDGLWDVVSNDTACGVARMCLQSRKPPSPPRSPGNDISVTAAGESSDKACSDASILLTKLALARHSTDNVSVVVVDLRKSP